MGLICKKNVKKNPNLYWVLQIHIHHKNATKL